MSRATIWMGNICSLINPVHEKVYEGATELEIPGIGVYRLFYGRNFVGKGRYTLRMPPRSTKNRRLNAATRDPHELLQRGMDRF